MKILFTKKVSPILLAENFGGDVSATCIQTLDIQPNVITPFNIKDYSLIFSSVNAVKPFFESGFQPIEDFTKHYNKIYCVGEKTKKELRKHGFGTFKVMKNAKELSEFIIEKCNKEKFYHFCGNLALDVLNESLPLQNIEYHKVILYQTIEKQPKINEVYDAIVFFSPSGVRSFAKNNTLEHTLLFSIGETTSQEIQKYTSQPIITSHQNSLSDLLKIIKEHITEKQ